MRASLVGALVCLLTILFVPSRTSASSPVPEGCENGDPIAGRVMPVAFIGDSPKMQHVKSLIERIAPHDSIVLISGETGTGKEVVAAAIHQASSRRAGPYHAENVANIPETLAEARLFGHEKGAFTGADKAQPGLFEQLDGGTLFLDEFGELSLEIQAKLLRVIEGHPFQRVGGHKEIKANVRIIVATNRNLAQLIDEKKFREDLFHRINVLPIVLPPLRERREDIPVLAEFFFHQLAPIYSVAQRRKPLTGFTSRAMHKMQYELSWPGNVRELRSAIERAIVLLPFDQDVIDADHITSTDSIFLPEPLEGAEGPIARIRRGENVDFTELEGEILRSIITAALEANDWNVPSASRQLGLTADQLRRRMRTLSISRPGR